jgi:hypothetical protein
VTNQFVGEVRAVETMRAAPARQCQAHNPASAQPAASAASVREKPEATSVGFDILLPSVLSRRAGAALPSVNAVRCEI